MYFHLYFEDFLKKYFYLYLYFFIGAAANFHGHVQKVLLFILLLLYATHLKNQTQIKTCIDRILNNPQAQKLLQQYNSGLVDISRYLLPKLHHGPVYHLLYLTDTIESLQQFATDDNDKTMLKDTLDTLRVPKSRLEKLEFKSYCYKPIENSLRMFQAEQFFEQSEKHIRSIDGSNLSLSLASNSSILTDVHNLSIGSNKKSLEKAQNADTAFVSNTIVLTHRKKKEIENKVESFKWPSYVNQPVVQFGTARPVLSGNDSTIQNELSVRNPYLYEGKFYARKQRKLENGVFFSIRTRGVY